MSRTLVAHVIFPRPDAVRPVLGFTWDAVRALAASRELDVDVLMPLPMRSARSSQSLIRHLRGAASWPREIETQLAALEPRPILIPYMPLPNRSIESAAVAISAHLLAKPRAERPALLHGSFLDQGGFAAVMAARVAGVPSIAVAHGTDVRAARGELENARGRKRRALEALRNATAVIAVSNHLAQELALLGRRAEVLRFTTTAERFPERPFSREAPEILFAGHQSRNKGLDLLLRAFTAIADKTATLRIVGARANDLDVRAEAEQLGIADRVAIEDEIPQAELARRYARASCVVLPSRAEGFGIVLIEALLVGRPVIGSDVGGIRDIIDPAVGRLVRPEDPIALASAIDDVLARVKSGAFDTRALRAKALPMTWEESGPELAALTRRLIAP